MEFACKDRDVRDNWVTCIQKAIVAQHEVAIAQYATSRGLVASAVNALTLAHSVNIHSNDIDNQRTIYNTNDTIPPLDIHALRMLEMQKKEEYTNNKSNSLLVDSNLPISPNDRKVQSN